jgi:integrase
MEIIDNAGAVTPPRRPWNKGKMIGPKPPLQPKHVWAIRTRLQLAGRTRDLALFNLAIDSKLRGCDVVRLRVEDVASHGYAVDRATVRQLPGPPRQNPLPPSHAPIRSPAVGVDRQYRSRPSLFGTHSLRRTKATLIYRRTGNLRAVQLLLGHTKVESTSDTSASRSMTRSRSPSRSTSEHRGRSATLCPPSISALSQWAIRDHSDIPGPAPVTALAFGTATI